MTVETFIITATRRGHACQDPAAALEHAIVESLRQWEHGEGTGWQMVGTHARVVRLPDTYGTLSVAWPMQTPDMEIDPTTLHQWLADSRTAITTALNTLSGRICSIGSGWQVHIQPFDPVINGPLSWWQDGQGADTQTRDQSAPWLDVLNLSIPNENFVGPTRPLRTAVAAGASGERALAALEKIATTTLWVGLGGVALYGLFKIVKGTSFKEPEPTPAPFALGPGAAPGFGGFGAAAPPARRLSYAERYARTLPGLEHGYR